MDESHVPEGQGSSGKGCLIASLVMLALVVGYFVYFYFQYQKLKWQRAYQYADALVAASSRDEQAKTEAKDLLYKLVQAAKDDTIKVDDQRGIEALRKLLDKPGLGFYVGAYEPIRTKAIGRSGLSAEERQAARVLFLRACWAFQQGKLKEQDINQWRKSSFRDEDELGTKQKLTDDEVRKIITGLEELLAEKDIPQDATFHYEYELDQLLNECRQALGMDTEELVPPDATTQPASATQPAATQATQPTEAPATAPD